VCVCVADKNFKNYNFGDFRSPKCRTMTTKVNNVPHTTVGTGDNRTELNRKRCDKVWKRQMESENTKKKKNKANF